MRKNCVMALCFMLIGSMLLNEATAWPSTAETIVPVDEQTKAGAPAPSTPVKEDRIWDTPKGLGWENRFFDTPLSAFHFKQNQFHLPSASGIPLKSPGRFPGIELGVEMHSFQALQSLVPRDRLANSPNDQQNQPLPLSPTTHSPDYNGGFLRFTW